MQSHYYFDENGVVIPQPGSAGDSTQPDKDTNHEPKVYNFSGEGGIGGNPQKSEKQGRKETLRQARDNTLILNVFCENNAKPGDTLVFPKGEIFWFMGGVHIVRLAHVTFVIDGTIKFVGGYRAKLLWPKEEHSILFCKDSIFLRKTVPCFRFKNCHHIRLTSSTKPLIVDKEEKESQNPFPGTSDDTDTRLHFDGNGHGGVIHGGGEHWWGIPRFAIRQEHRPMLIHMQNCEDILFENIELRSSPYWSFYADNIKRLEVRWSKSKSVLDTKLFPFKDDNPHAFWTQLAYAFNTDGFDVKGTQIRIHHVEVMCQDDCLCVKSERRMENNDGYTDIVASEDIRFENSRASGIGLVIGSIGARAKVRDVHYTNIYMPHTHKGIYLKFRDIAEDDDGKADDGGFARISEIYCENITMYKPKDPIWIGPAQQADSNQFWRGHPASILWPKFSCCGCIGVTCPPTRGYFEDILLKNIKIINPIKTKTGGIGVIRADSEFPIKKITFDNVCVEMENGEPIPEKDHDKYFYYVGDKPKNPANDDIRDVAAPEALSLLDCRAFNGTWPVPYYFQNDVERKEAAIEE